MTTKSGAIVPSRKRFQLICPITLDAKRAGARSAGNPHAACEVAGIGNGITDDPTRARRGKPRRQTRGVLRVTAPVLDPTSQQTTISQAR